MLVTSTLVLGVRSASTSYVCYLFSGVPEKRLTVSGVLDSSCSGVVYSFVKASPTLPFVVDVPVT